MKKELSDQMLDDNFESHGNKDNAAEKLGACLIFIAEDAADFHADQAANKCRQTNKQHSGYDIHLKKGEGNADGKRVNACGDSQR